MADEQAADAGGQEAIVERVAGGEGALTAAEAARSLLDTRRKEQAGQDGAESSDTAEQESPAQAEDTAQEAGPGETQGDDQQQETAAPIDPPRSWTKEDKELFKGLPRETQERLAARERSREGDFLKRQQTAAEQLKGLTAKEQAAEQVRAQYEQALPMLLQSIQETHAGNFADIKTIQDVERLAAEDWPRYVQWDASQKKIAAVQQQTIEAQNRQKQEKSAKWQEFVKAEDALFLEKAPELADNDKAMKAGKSALAMLTDLGFSGNELDALWRGDKELSIRDHRVQLLIRDGVRYRDAQAKVKTAAAKPVPQVQRPGVVQPRGAANDERVQALNAKLSQTGSLKDAAALLVAKRQASR